jgi:hypothetical protein
VSGVERLWLGATRIAPPFVNQMVIEAPGASLTSLDWERALAAMAQRTPGVSLVLRGAWGWARWEDLSPPALRAVDARDWTAQDGGGAPFLARSLDVRQGPTVELLVCEGRTPRVVLRTAHAVMDGMGTLLVAERLFAALRGEELAPMAPVAVTDAQLASELGVTREPTPSLDCPAPLGEVRGAPAATRWVRRDLPGPPRRALLPRAAVALARRVPAASRPAVRIDVPVDMRRHRPGLVSTANLTGLVRLPVGALLERDQPVEATAEALRAALDRHEEARFVIGMGGVRWVPVGLIERIGRRGAHGALAAGQFSSSATLSNLGRVDVTRLRAPGFEPGRVFFIPPGSPGLPLFLTITGTPTGVTLCGAAPLGLADGGRLELLLDDLAAQLSVPPERSDAP